MSTHLEVVDLAAEFNNLRDKKSVIIINDYKTTSAADKNFIKDLIYTKYNNDVMSSVPRCNCPAENDPIVGADRAGEYCPKCNTKVSARFDSLVKYEQHRPSIVRPLERVLHPTTIKT